MNITNTPMLNQMTLNKLMRTLTRQKEAMAETEHHIELVKAAIEKDEAEAAKEQPRLQPTKK